MSLDTQTGRREPFRAVLGFTFRHWTRQPSQVAWVAGVTIAAFSVPESMAYASLAGVSPEHGVESRRAALLDTGDKEIHAP